MTRRTPATTAVLLFTLLLATSLAGCLDGEDETTALRILSYDVFVISDEMVEAFEAEHEVEVELIKVDDTGAVLARALQSQAAGAPIADLIIGIDNTYLQDALDAGLYQSWSRHTEVDLRRNVTSEAFVPYSGDLVIPFDWGHVCLNYDDAWRDSQDIPVPTSLWNLTEDDWAGRVVVPNARTSSPGRAFLVATVDAMEQDEDTATDFTDWWAAMEANDLIVVDSWSQAYEVHYSAGYGKWNDGHIGDARVVVSYCHSPGAEAFWSEGGSTSSRALDIDHASFRQVEYAGIAADADEPGLAAAFMAALLSESVQAQIPETNVMIPVFSGMGLPAGPYANHTVTPGEPAGITAQRIGGAMPGWLAAWDTAVA